MIIKINDMVGDWLTMASQVLGDGGVIAFPTETVYGLAVCPTVPGAIEKLNALKERKPEKPYTLQVSSFRKLKKYVPHPSIQVQQLARKAWPGPLTMVVELSDADAAICKDKFGELYDKIYSENSIGLRCPDNKAALAILNKFDGPLIVPSANPADAEPAVSAEQVEDYFGNRVSLILDGGEAEHKKASTVVKISKTNEIEILRKGVIDRKTIDELCSLSIVFVCSGNTCRSPMAAALGRKILAEKIGCSIDELEANGVSITSAGTYAARGLPAARAGVMAMRKFGLDISDHQSQPATPALINQADLVYVMSPDHQDFLSQTVPEAIGKIRLLSPTGVDDPIGSSENTYVQCAKFLSELINEQIKEEFE